MIFEDQSICPLCKTVMNDISNVIAFPPLTSNVKEPLFILSDNAVHKECLYKFRLKQDALLFKQQYNNNLPPNVVKCIVDHEEIKDPHDIISFNLLTSDKKEPLYPFNYEIINRKNVSKWKDRCFFIEKVKCFLERNKWQPFGEFNFLEYLIKELSMK